MSQSGPVPSEIPRATTRAFRKKLIPWYRDNRRDLPWRQTSDPYAITVSEFMLQQTQVATVLPYYQQWLEQFPDWQTLAEAQEVEILKAWEGLGYYSRARNLHKLAKTLCQQPRGDKKALPEDVETLKKLPGFGEYTARAVASIAFGRPAAVLDGNVIRVLARVFNVQLDVSVPRVKKSLWHLVDQLAPRQDCATFNQATMELGALLCKPRQPDCSRCPLRTVCQATNPESLPRKRRRQVEVVDEKIAVIRSRSRYWCEKTNQKGRLQDLWRFPELDSTTMVVGKELTQFTYGITKYRVNLTAIAATWKQGASQTGKWLTSEEAAALPFAAAHRKLYNLLVKGAAP